MPEDVTHLLGGDQPPPQEPQAEQPPSQEQPPSEAPAPEETVSWIIGGRERQIPVSLAQQFAKAAMDEEDPDSVRNALALGSRYNSDMSRQGRENAQLRAKLAQLEAAQGVQPMAPTQRQPQQPQYQNPQQPPDPTNDPVNYLAYRFDTRQEALERKFDAYIQAQQTATLHQEQQREAQVLEQSYNNWAEKKKAQGFKNVPSLEEMDQLAADLELGATSLPYDKAFEVAWNVYYGDQVAQTAQKAAVDNLRKPNAKIVVPGGGASRPAQPAANPADQLGGMTWGQGIEFIPEKR
jgi:hypothetical protein